MKDLILFIKGFNIPCIEFQNKLVFKDNKLSVKVEQCLNTFHITIYDGIAEYDKWTVGDVNLVDWVIDTLSNFLKASD